MTSATDAVAGVASAEPAGYDALMYVFVSALLRDTLKAPELVEDTEGEAAAGVDLVSDEIAKSMARAITGFGT